MRSFNVLKIHYFLGLMRGGERLVALLRTIKAVYSNGLLTKTVNHDHPVLYAEAIKPSTECQKSSSHINFTTEKVSGEDTVS